MKLRGERWDLEGNSAEEEFWEERKTQVYRGLGRLAAVIERVFKDRQKETVMEMWRKEAAVDLAASKAKSRGYT